MQHLVSHVEGLLKPGMTNLDVLRATFPAGTLPARRRCGRWRSSTSSSRCKRGIYGGAVGYLSFNGDMDLAIAIRTACHQGQRAVRAGGGRHGRRLGARDEWQETEAKARAVLRAAEQVEDGFDSE